MSQRGFFFCPCGREARQQSAKLYHTGSNPVMGFRAAMAERQLHLTVNQAAFGSTEVRVLFAAFLGRMPERYWRRSVTPSAFAYESSNLSRLIV